MNHCSYVYITTVSQNVNTILSKNITITKNDSPAKGSKVSQAPLNRTKIGYKAPRASTRALYPIFMQNYYHISIMLPEVNFSCITLFPAVRKAPSQSP